MSDLIAVIGACEYLHMQAISGPDDGGVRLVVHEARTGGPVNAEVLESEPLAEVRKILAQSSAIVHGPGCKVFTITPPTYIGYCIENESFALPEPESSIGEGRLFRTYSNSVYLDFVAKASFASTEYPGP